MTLISKIKYDMNGPTRLALMLIRLVWRVPTLRTFAYELQATLNSIETTLIT